jgi:small subunit ribosomal protein S6
MAQTAVKRTRIYETYMILDTAVSKEQQDALVAKLKRAVEDAGGKWVLETSRGKKKLAHPLKKRTEALHWVTYAEGPGGVPAEIAQVLRFETSVLRSQTVVVEKVPEPQAEPTEAPASPAAESGEGQDPEEKDGEL